MVLALEDRGHGARGAETGLCGGVAAVVVVCWGPVLHPVDPDFRIGHRPAATVLLALFLAWTMGDGHDHLQDVGGLGTAQRGTAAALIPEAADVPERSA